MVTLKNVVSMLCRGYAYVIHIWVIIYINWIFFFLPNANYWINDVIMLGSYKLIFNITLFTSDTRWRWVLVWRHDRLFLLFYFLFENGSESESCFCILGSVWHWWVSEVVIHFFFYQTLWQTLTLVYKCNDIIWHAYFIKRSDLRNNEDTWLR